MRKKWTVKVYMRNYYIYHTCHTAGRLVRSKTSFKIYQGNKNNVILVGGEVAKRMNSRIRPADF